MKEQPKLIIKREGDVHAPHLRVPMLGRDALRRHAKN
jgi:hypothetical protein